RRRLRPLFGSATDVQRARRRPSPLKPVPSEGGSRVAKITVKQVEEVKSVVGRDVVPEGLRANYSELELDGIVTRYFPDGAETLELNRYSFPPGTEIRPHAHTASEIIYVTEGEIHLGAKVCRAGSAVFIDEMVLYGFRAGPAGVTFLNFRGTPGSRYLSKDE